MSFFGALNKIIQGKPVFEPEDGHSGHTSPHPQPAAPSRPNGPKVLPRVFIEETSCRENGARMECYGFVRNDSERPMELDKVRIFSTSRELDTVLQPGEKRQFLLYSGNRPRDAHNHECELWYRDMTGDYFSGLHDVQLQKQADNTYLVAHIRYHGIRDI